MQNVESFKVSIIRACQFLKDDLFEISTKEYWQSIADNIIKELDSNKDKLYFLKEELENLAVMVLFRITTRLGSIKLRELYSSGREILKRLRTISLPRAVTDGINEFLLTPAECFKENKVYQEVELLSHQVAFLEEIIQKENAKKTAAMITTLPAVVDVVEGIQEEILRPSENLELLKEPEILKEEKFDAKEEEKEDDEIKMLLSPSESRIEGHSLCLLDLEGNFILTDKASEGLFELSQTGLLDKNLFNLMIPFSAFHLKKKLGSFIFHSTRSQAKTFSYTIYSKKALNKYQKLISKHRRKKDNSIPKFVEDEKIFHNEGNNTYYKYLKTLTSCATLINIKFSCLDNIKKLEESQGVKVNTEHKLFKKKGKANEDEGFIAVLLLTRKAKHVQKFRYWLMNEYDQNIVELENTVKRKVTTAKDKMDDQESNLNQKRALILEGNEIPGNKKVK